MTMKLGLVVKFGTKAGAIFGYLTKDDILIILMILITGLQLLYDYLKDRKD